MRKISLGIVSGFVLGLLEGVAIYIILNAQGVKPSIILITTLSGLVLGGVMGLISRTLRSPGNNMYVGLVIGLIISSMAGALSPYFMEVTVIGMFIGMLLGIIVGKYGK